MMGVFIWLGLTTQLVKLLSNKIVHRLPVGTGGFHGDAGDALLGQPGLSRQKIRRCRPKGLQLESGMTAAIRLTHTGHDGLLMHIGYSTSIFRFLSAPMPCGASAARSQKGPSGAWPRVCSTCPAIGGARNTVLKLFHAFTTAQKIARRDGCTLIIAPPRSGREVLIFMSEGAALVAWGTVPK